MDASSPPVRADPRQFGHIPGVSFGAKFNSRKELWEAGVHGQLEAGIHGDPSPDMGAFSICISGGYEDDKDMGDKIIYVGAGGRDDSGRQIRDQVMFDGRGNESLYYSSKTKRAVRVIRGKDESNKYAPPNGYRYDGLYVVDLAEMGQGKSGYNMCFFKLRRIHEEGDGHIPYQRITTEALSKMLKKARNN